MSKTEQQLQQIEMDIERAREMVERKRAIERLFENEDFKSVVMDGFLDDEAQRVILAKADPELQMMPGKIDELDRLGIAIGEFNMWLFFQRKLGQQAEQAIAADEETREELLAEQLAE